jgi:hypothetical protein
MNWSEISEIAFFALVSITYIYFIVYVICNAYYSNKFDFFKKMNEEIVYYIENEEKEQ